MNQANIEQASEMADVHSASAQYTERFAGPAGQWMLEVQEKAVIKMLADIPSARILDVGGGHGQLSIPLARLGYPVTVIASAPDGLGRVESLRSLDNCRLDIGDLLRLPYADKQFEVVLCFRLLPHCPEWPILISELCRVAAQLVILDYPSSRSINAIAPLLFKAKKKVEKNTRPFELFTPNQIAIEFHKYNFSLKQELRQFFWPMVIHRMLKQPQISQSLEQAPRWLGLSARFGSPVIACMRRM